MIREINANAYSSNHFVRWIIRLLAVREEKLLRALLEARRGYLLDDPYYKREFNKRCSMVRREI